jgi:hypothetical protein
MGHAVVPGYGQHKFSRTFLAFRMDGPQPPFRSATVANRPRCSGNPVQGLNRTNPTTGILSPGGSQIEKNDIAERGTGSRRFSSQSMNLKSLSVSGKNLDVLGNSVAYPQDKQESRIQEPHLGDDVFFRLTVFG